MNHQRGAAILLPFILAATLVNSLSWVAEHVFGVSPCTIPPPIWEAETPAQVDVCAVKNFGAAGAAELKHREQLCRECGSLYGESIGATPQYCAVSCGDGG